MASEPKLFRIAINQHIEESRFSSEALCDEQKLLPRQQANLVRLHLGLYFVSSSRWSEQSAVCGLLLTLSRSQRLRNMMQPDLLAKPGSSSQRDEKGPVNLGTYIFIDKPEVVQRVDHCWLCPAQCFGHVLSHHVNEAHPGTASIQGWLTFTPRM